MDRDLEVLGLLDLDFRPLFSTSEAEDTEDLDMADPDLDLEPEREDRWLPALAGEDVGEFDLEEAADDDDRELMTKK